MKVLIPIRHTEKVAEGLKLAGYDVIGFTEDIEQFKLRCEHCDAVLFVDDPDYYAPSSVTALSMAYGRKKPLVMRSDSENGYTEVADFSLSVHAKPSISTEKPDHRTLPKILIVGPGRCGKDSLGEFIHKHSKHTYAGSTSKFLAKYVAKEFKISEEQAYSLRHEHRQRWFEIGNTIREDDHGLLQKEALEVGNVVAGIRDFREAAWACYNEIYDHIIWIDADVEPDTTLTFTSHDIAVMLQGKKTKLTIIKNNKDSQFFTDARKLIEAIK